MGDGTPNGRQSQDRILRRNAAVTERIGRNIRLARLERDYTQQQLAHLVDEWTTNNAVSRWERGEVRPLPRTLERIAEVVGKDVDWFYSERDEGVAA